MDRTISVDNLESVRRAMERLPGYIETEGSVRLFQVVQGRPMTEAHNRVPVANKTRWTNYVRKDGKKSKANRTWTGSMNQLNFSLGVRVKGTKVLFGTVNMDVPYAPYVHEAKKPREGQYWMEGMLGYGRGWSRPGSGNKFIEKPVRNTSAYVIRTLSQKIDEDLARRGL